MEIWWSDDCLSAATAYEEVWKSKRSKEKSQFLFDLAVQCLFPLSVH